MCAFVEKKKFLTLAEDWQILGVQSVAVFGLCVAMFVTTPRLHGIVLHEPAQGEFDWWTKVNENLRLAVDLSSRVNYRDDAEGGFAQNFVGFDLHKVVSTKTGDLGTLTLQGYWTRVDDFQSHPGLFEAEDDWEFVYRIFNFNYTGFGGKMPNFRIGHFEVPFGLEQVINTNGTLRQYLNGRNLGFKGDWGISLNGLLGDYDYEYALTQGSGNDLTWRSLNGQYVFSGRIGRSDIFDTFDLGLSQYYAEQGPRSERRYRVGVDGRYFYRNWDFLAELSLGENDDRAVLAGTFEIDRSNRSETLLLFAQWHFLRMGANENLQWVFGSRYTPDSRWSLSAQLKQDWVANLKNHSSTEIGGQVRYRF